MVMGNNMGMYRTMCPNPPMGMNSPMIHSPNAHQMNNSMMMNGPMNSPRMNHMGPGQGPGHGPPPHMLPSPNGPGGPGVPMGPNMNMTGMNFFIFTNVNECSNSFLWPCYFDTNEK